MLVFIRIQLALRLSPGYILHTYSSLNGVESRPQSVTLAAHIGIKRSELIFFVFVLRGFFCSWWHVATHMLIRDEHSLNWTLVLWANCFGHVLYWGSRRWKKSSLLVISLHIQGPHPSRIPTYCRYCTFEEAVRTRKRRLSLFSSHWRKLKIEGGSLSRPCRPQSTPLTSDYLPRSLI